MLLFNCLDIPLMKIKKKTALISGATFLVKTGTVSTQLILPYLVSSHHILSNVCVPGKDIKTWFSASCCRKSELHQVAQQASNIGELIEVIRVSLSVMSKQWSDAMHTFREKFDALSMLIINHGSNRYYRYSCATLIFPLLMLFLLL